RSQRPDPILRQVVPEQRGPLPSHQHSLRGDLHTSRNGGKTVVENVLHIKFMEILCIRTRSFR
ncbi:hypothetical protein B296_00053685, partial [Ensete ventricosum]